ncbi:MAG TPA: hypothetical protein VGR37_21780 [Longimicrobiaceae bacterium]|nr:hypothetical protein [Longimicrobiaceae bacterium]
METENLRLLIEAAESITLQVLFVMVLDIMESFVTSMVWYLIMLIFLVKLFALFAAHLVAKRMGDQLGFYWPYSSDEKDRIYQIFMKGLETEREDPQGEASA